MLESWCWEVEIAIFQSTFSENWHQLAYICYYHSHFRRGKDLIKTLQALKVKPAAGESCYYGLVLEKAVLSPCLVTGFNCIYPTMSHCRLSTKNTLASTSSRWRKSHPRRMSAYSMSSFTSSRTRHQTALSRGRCWSSLPTVISASMRGTDRWH